MPAQVKKPKQKASVEGAVGKIARKIIGMLRNESFHSIEGLNSEIRKVLGLLNDKPFQKRNGSRKTIYDLEEKPYLRVLPMLPFEICEWSQQVLSEYIPFEEEKYFEEDYNAASDKGIGLIESIRQGVGKPNIIYVKNFVSSLQA